MNRRFCEKLIGVCLLPIGIVFSSVQLVAADKDSRLRASDPFYLPYRNDFFISVGIAHSQQKLSFDIPAQIVNLGSGSVSLSASSGEQITKAIEGLTTVSYGIIDRLSIAVSGRFLLNEKRSITYSGITSSGGGSPDRSGAYAPEFATNLRLLGVRRDAWYLDLRTKYIPGIISNDANAVVVPQHNLQTGISFGRNHGGFSVGLGTYANYLFEAQNGIVRYRPYASVTSEAVMQYGFGNVFLRVRGSWSTYVDSDSRQDPILKLVRTNLYFDTGLHFSENFFL